MRAGEDHDLDLVEARHVAALPAGQPGDDRFQPAEAALRLGQRVLPARDRSGGGLVAGREVGLQAARNSSKDLKGMDGKSPKQSQ